jgi:hypothetical protein
MALGLVTRFFSNMSLKREASRVRQMAEQLERRQEEMREDLALLASGYQKRLVQKQEWLQQQLEQDQAYYESILPMIQAHLAFIPKVFPLYVQWERVRMERVWVNEQMTEAWEWSRVLEKEIGQLNRVREQYLRLADTQGIVEMIRLHNSDLPEDFDQRPLQWVKYKLKDSTDTDSYEVRSLRQLQRTLESFSEYQRELKTVELLLRQKRATLQKLRAYTKQLRLEKDRLKEWREQLELELTPLCEAVKASGARISSTWEEPLKQLEASLADIPDADAIVQAYKRAQEELHFQKNRRRGEENVKQSAYEALNLAMARKPFVSSEVDAYRRMIDGCKQRIAECKQIMVEQIEIIEKLRPTYQKINEIYRQKKIWNSRRRTITSALRESMPLQLEAGRRVQCWSVERLASDYES